MSVMVARFQSYLTGIEILEFGPKSVPQIGFQSYLTGIEIGFPVCGGVVLLVPIEPHWN